MYEAEVNDLVESIETLPLGIRQRFAEYRDQVVARTVLPWGEHCTECVWPVCYTTCELYTPRKGDGACRQFVDGMVRIDHKGGLSPYLLKLRFKRWAKLWTVGNLSLQPLGQAGQQELYNIVVGAIGRSAPLPGSIKSRVLTKISYLRRQSAERAKSEGDLPDCFLLECFNPNDRQVDLTLTIRPRELPRARCFQTMISVPPGYKREEVSCVDIFKFVDRRKPFEVEIVPNGADNTVLYFGLMDFVKERQSRVNGGRLEVSTKFKCIVWDLDNTIWDGVLIEDGPEKIRLRQGVVDVIKKMDQRGVLHSVASKNNHDDAMKVLRSIGLDDYFLYPQITWQPKSQSIAQVAQALNIGVDSLAFVDDQAFEREEVRAALPQITVIDALKYQEIPNRPECDVPVTAESQNRRAMYREQEQREVVLKSYSGDYFAFLRSCGMEVVLTPLTDTNLKRVYELAQRTNQMNFSGNRYQEAQLAEIMKSSVLEPYVIACADRFGNYGIVGFAVVDVREPRLLDLMFSCRVQSKRVEHGVLSYLLTRFVTCKDQDFYASYRKTAKNAPSGKVFEEMGFEWVDESEGISSLVFKRGKDIVDDQIVTMTVAGCE